MALTKLTSNLIEGGIGTDWVTAIQTSNFTAEAGKGYFVNTTSQVLYVNLPAGVAGMEITIQDYAGTFATNKVILNANGSEKIQGSDFQGKITTNNATAVLIYQDAIEGWTSQDVELNLTAISWATPTGQGLTYSTPSPQSSQGAAAATFPTTTFTATLPGSEISGTATIAGLPSGITAAQTITGSGAGNTLTVTLTGTFPSTDSLNTNLTLSGLTLITYLTVDYLVVAGGGAGNQSNGGGAGAGGLRTSWPGGSGGGGPSESQAMISTGSNYIVTIGAGGVQNGANPSTIANDGSDSIFYNITSNGGGAAGSRAGYPARPGGSGGGGGSTGGAGNQAAAGTTNQGYAGANGVDGGGYRGGGGGGAGASGTWPNGGAGKEVNIIGGTGNYYAGGGGGGANSGPGSGGIGGGGAGTSSWTMNSGTANTGGGGGSGAMGGTVQGGNGGSGIVILRYPNTKTITIPGGLTATTTTDGSDKVTTFTAGTGNISFS
jgi:hypothetical protein